MERIMEANRLPKTAFRRCGNCGQGVSAFIFLGVYPDHLSRNGYICLGKYPPDPENHSLDIPTWMKER